MSILFVHERASFMGGVEQNIADCVKAFRRNGVDCHLAFNPQLPADRSFSGLFNTAHPSNELAATRSILATSTLADIASSTGARTVYIHKVPSIPESLFEANVRTVQMVHDHDLCCPRRHKYFVHNASVCNKPLGLHCYADLAFLVRDRESRVGVRFQAISAKQKELRSRRRLDLSIVASTFMREELLMNGFPAHRVQTIPLAVPVVHSEIASRRSEIPTILFVGQLIRGKGVDLLLRALAKLRNPFRAIIVGKGNAEGALRHQCTQLGLDRVVDFIGWIANSDLLHYYSQAHVLALPSRWPEPFGMVGLEAMHYGKPVVAFNVGGIPDWLRHEVTGLLAAPGDVATFALYLERLLADTNLAAQYGVAAANELKRNFGFADYMDRLHAALLPNEYRTTAMLDRECA